MKCKKRNYAMSQFFKNKELKWLTSVPVDGWSLGCRRAWHWAEVSAGEPGGPVDSDPWDCTSVGERSLKWESDRRVEMETWQLDEEGEEGRAAEDRRGLGDGLRGGDGCLCGIRDGVLGEGESLEGDDAEASRRLRANRALLVLAELFWAESLEWRGVDRESAGCPPEWDFSLSDEANGLDLFFSSCPKSLSSASSSSCALFLSSVCWSSCSLSGWTEGSSETPRTGRILLQLSNHSSYPNCEIYCFI